MTKLVVVLAVVVVVILVVVIVAVRNMRAEDPDEFADRPIDRGRTRGHHDERDPRYDRREPARAGRGARPAGRQGSEGYRSSGGGRGLDERRDQQRPRGYDQRTPDRRDYDSERAPGPRAGRGHGDRRGAPSASGASPGPDKRRRPDSDAQRRPDETPAPARARQGRSRRSSDSSEWDSSEWEKLSDVDYWAELASDKPLTTTAQPAAQPSAAPRNGARRAAPDPDQEAETMAVRSQVPAGAPRRDPVTGLPVRGPQQAAEAGMAEAARTDFAAAPVPVAGTQDRPRPAATSGGPARPERSTQERRRPDRARPAREVDSRSLAEMGSDRGAYDLAGPASLPIPVIRATTPPRGSTLPPGPSAPAAPQQRPRMAADDDPLTSPSFPKVPASDSRSYHNGRGSAPPGGSRGPATPPGGSRAPATPPGGSRAPASYLAPTQQFSSYGSPAPQYPAPEPQYPAPERPAAPLPATPRSQRPAGPRSGAHSAPPGSGAHSAAPQHGAAPRPASPRPAQHSADPGGYQGRASAPPPASAPSGNPYGSYVTPDSQPTVASSYDDYPALSGHDPSAYLPPVGAGHMGQNGNGNGHGAYLPPPASAGHLGQNGNGYWHDPAHAADPGGSAYPDGGTQVPDPRDAGVQGNYRNGYGEHGEADYPPDGYPADPQNPAGYPPVDPYGRDGYGGYPEYGAAGR